MKKRSGKANSRLIRWLNGLHSAHPRVLKKMLLVLVLVVSALETFAQIETRTLSGTVSLDVGVASQDYLLNVTVNSHSFVVVPPSFTILRPVISSASQQLTIQAGDAEVDFLVSDIMLDPVDYSVRIECINCRSRIPTQFYSPSGNRFGLTNSTYIDPGDLLSPLQITAITRGTISGTISLSDALIAERDLEYSISVVSAADLGVIFATQTGLVIGAGETAVAYAISGLNRQAANQGYRVQLRCQNCVGSSARLVAFAQVLSSFEDHEGIDFAVSNSGHYSIAPILELLL